MKDDYPNSEQEDEEEEPLPLSLPPEDEGEEEDEVSGEMKEERMTPGGVVVMDEPQVRRLSTSLRLSLSVLSPSQQSGHERSTLTHSFERKFLNFIQSLQPQAVFVIPDAVFRLRKSLLASFYMIFWFDFI